MTLSSLLQPLEAALRFQLIWAKLFWVLPKTCQLLLHHPTCDGFWEMFGWAFVICFLLPTRWPDVAKFLWAHWLLLCISQQRPFKNFVFSPRQPFLSISPHPYFPFICSFSCIYPSRCLSYNLKKLNLIKGCSFAMDYELISLSRSTRAVLRWVNVYHSDVLGKAKLSKQLYVMGSPLISSAHITKIKAIKQ